MTIRKKTLIFIYLMISITLLAGVKDKDNLNNIAKGDLHFEISTDKDVYHRGETIMLSAKFKNLTDHKITMVRDTGFLFFLKVIAKKCKVVLPAPCEDEHGGLILDENGLIKIEEVEKTFDDYEVPRTALGEFYRHGPLKRSFRPFTILPHGESTCSLPIPLNVLFDVTYIPYRPDNHPTIFTVELEYNVMAEELGYPVLFTIKPTTSFQVIPKYVSSSKKLDEQLESVFGKNKAIKHLCDEAETIIKAMKAHPEMQTEAAEEYKRLMTILASLGRLSQLDFDQNLAYLQLHNRTTLADFEALVSKCRTKMAMQSSPAP